MKYTTEYKSRKIVISQNENGTYRVTRILGCSQRTSVFSYCNMSLALKDMKNLIDRNKAPLSDPCVILSW